MKMTSAQAAKLIRQLSDELRTLQTRENNSESFLAALGEDPETVRPEYDYSAMQKAQSEIERKIRKVKHAVNVFNSVTVVPELGMTIDEVLVYLPQLTSRCSKLSRMKDALPKTRENSGYSRGTTVIDYRYANYDIAQAGKDYSELSAELAKVQTALDYVNNTVEFEIEV